VEGELDRSVAMSTYVRSLSNASWPRERLQPRAMSCPVSRSLMERPTEYAPATEIESSDRRRTSILRLVSACQNAGCTRDAKGANCTTGMVEAREGEQARIGKCYIHGEVLDFLVMLHSSLGPCQGLAHDVPSRLFRQHDLEACKVVQRPSFLDGGAFLCPCRVFPLGNGALLFELSADDARAGGAGELGEAEGGEGEMAVGEGLAGDGGGGAVDYCLGMDERDAAGRDTCIPGCGR